MDWSQNKMLNKDTIFQNDTLCNPIHVKLHNQKNLFQKANKWLSRFVNSVRIHCKRASSLLTFASEQPLSFTQFLFNFQANIPPPQLCPLKYNLSWTTLESLKNVSMLGHFSAQNQLKKPHFIQMYTHHLYLSLFNSS
jgi:hypothetical protein